MRVEHFSENLEKSLDRVVANLPVRAAEAAPDQNSEKERVKEALRRLAEQEAEDPVVEAPESNPTLPDYMSEEGVEPDAQKKLEYLIGVAMDAGLPAALKLAKKEDVFIQDALHDALTDKLLPRLKSEGRI